MLSGTAVSQMINICSLLIFTRLYTPNDFGQYYIYFSVVNVLLMVACYRYELVILTVPPGRKLYALTKLITYLCVANALILFMVILAFNDYLTEHLKIGPEIIFVFPLALLIGGLYQAISFFPVRNRKYALVGAHKISHSGIFLLCGIAFSKSPFANFGLISADVIGRVFATLHIIIAEMVNKDYSLYRWISVTREEYIEIGRDNITSLTSVFPGTLLSALTAFFLPYFLINQYSVEVVGQYSLVERFVIAPCTIFAVAVSQIVTGDFAAKVRDRPSGLQNQFRKLLRLLVSVGIGVAVVCWVLAPTMVSLFFGDEWKYAGTLARYSVVYIATVLVATPVNMLLLISGRYVMQLSWDLARFTIMATFFLILSYCVDVTVHVALIALGCVAALCYGFFIYLVDDVLGQLDCRGREEKTATLTEIA